MSYLIDSNIIISFLDDESPAQRLLESLAGTERFISVIALAVVSTFMEKATSP